MAWRKVQYADQDPGAQWFCSYRMDGEHVVTQMTADCFAHVYREQILIAMARIRFSALNQRIQVRSEIEFPPISDLLNGSTADNPVRIQAKTSGVGDPVKGSGDDGSDSEATVSDPLRYLYVTLEKNLDLGEACVVKKKWNFKGKRLSPEELSKTLIQPLFLALELSCEPSTSRFEGMTEAASQLYVQAEDLLARPEVDAAESEPTASTSQNETAAADDAVSHDDERFELLRRDSLERRLQRRQQTAEGSAPRKKKKINL